MWRREKRRIVIKNRCRLITIGLSILLTFHRTAQWFRGRTPRSGSIEPRSRHDRAAIGELQRRNRLQTIGRRSTNDQDDAWTSPEHWISIKRRRNIMEELHDRSPIEEILLRDRRGFVSNRSAGDRRSTSIKIDARSRPDRGAIVAKIAAEIEFSLRLI